MDKDTISKYLTEQFERGRPILVTGSGFSQSACNLAGELLPTSNGLTKKIWELVYPADEFEEGTQLQDIFEIAKAEHRSRLIELLRNQLTVDPATSDLSIYEKIFSLPWYRVYTINIDNLDQAVDIKYSLKRRIKAIDGMPEKNVMTDKSGNISNTLFSIHLHGMLESSPDGITFGRLQYASRGRYTDSWYSAFISEIMTHPVVFLGTRLDEPPMWQHIEQRSTKGGRGIREHRPKSFLVVPSLQKARAGLLSTYNIIWLPLDLKEFYTEILSKCEPAMDSGYKSLGVLSREAQESIENDQKLFTVEDLLDQEPKNIIETASDFLMGSEPTWNDIRCAAASIRNCENDLIKNFLKCREAKQNSILILTGTAGSGKSTIAKSLALKLHEQGKHSGWIDQSHMPHPRIIKEAIEKEQAPTTIFIEDAYNYGQNLEPLIRELCSSRKKIAIVVVLRSNAVEKLFGDISKDTRFIEFSVPHLADDDINGLLDSLDKFNRLGVLKGKDRKFQHDIFKSKCGRQLLVAMIEATSGLDFEKKCTSEYEELTDQEKRFYEVTAVATVKEIAIAQEDLILATNQRSNIEFDLLKRMFSRGLLITQQGRIRLRHKVIAEKIFNLMIKENMAAEPITQLLFALCAKLDLSLPRSSRPWKNIASLLNHEFLYRACETKGAEAVYGELETILRDNYHYWLQRGSLHVEFGDLFLAENFLNQAHSMEPTDPYVIVERCYLKLKMAHTYPKRDDSEKMANEAIEDLVELISRRGKTNYHPFHVLGSQGLSWSRKGSLTVEKRLELLALLQEKVKEGKDLYPGRVELRQLLDDLKREYLLVGTGAK